MNIEEEEEETYNDGGETFLPPAVLAPVNENDDPSTSGKSTANVVVPDAEGEEEEDELTPQEVVLKLKQLWRNEAEAPELLTHRYDIVDCIVDQINVMQANLKAGGTSRRLRHRAHTVEVDRIRFMLHAYVRRRVDKIERMTHDIVADDNRRAASQLPRRLSNEERKLADSLIELYEKHMQNAVIAHLPSATKTVNWREIGATANLHHFVFARIGEQTIPNALIESSLATESHVPLPANTQHILPYSAVARYVNGELDDDEPLMHNVTLL